MDFDMGKYGLFVWGSYGLSFLGLAGLVALSVKAHADKARALAALNEAIKAVKPAVVVETPKTKEASAKEHSA
jgi:heme exporter protein CcmD